MPSYQVVRRIEATPQQASEVLIDASSGRPATPDSTK
jgi:hypothetical protein